MYPPTPETKTPTRNMESHKRKNTHCVYQNKHVEKWQGQALNYVTPQPVGTGAQRKCDSPAPEKTPCHGEVTVSNRIVYFCSEGRSLQGGYCQIN